MTPDKSDYRYWLSRLTKQKCARWTSSRYSVRFRVAGKPRLFTLNGKNKRDAATEAAELWKQHVGSAESAKVPASPTASSVPSNDSDTTSKENNPPTIGNLVACFSHTSVSSLSTQQQSITALLALAREIEGIKVTEGWKDAIHSIPLSSLTAGKIQKWTDTRSGSSGLSHSTIASRIRNARAVFSPAVLEELSAHQTSPIQSPFSSLKVTLQKKPRFRSLVNPEDVLEAGGKELGQSGVPAKIEQWKILYLIIRGRLRRNEIDTLKWSQIDREAKVIRIPSSHSSSKIRALTISPSFTKTLSSWSRADGNEFVISENRDSRKKDLRCGSHFAGLIQWIRKLEVSGSKFLRTSLRPLDELRRGAAYEARNKASEIELQGRPSRQSAKTKEMRQSMISYRPIMAAPPSHSSKRGSTSSGSSS
jgi:integrase